MRCAVNAAAAAAHAMYPAMPWVEGKASLCCRLHTPNANPHNTVLIMAKRLKDPIMRPTAEVGAICPLRVSHPEKKKQSRQQRNDRPAPDNRTQKQLDKSVRK